MADAHPLSVQRREVGVAPEMLLPPSAEQVSAESGGAAVHAYWSGSNVAEQRGRFSSEAATGSQMAASRVVRAPVRGDKGGSP